MIYVILVFLQDNGAKFGVMIHYCLDLNDGLKEEG